MYRSHNCGELNAAHINTEVTLAGWVQKSRDKGFMVWVDLRDRYGITQLIFDENRTDKAVFELAKTLGREFVIQVKGTVMFDATKWHSGMYFYSLIVDDVVVSTKIMIVE